MKDYEKYSVLEVGETEYSDNTTEIEKELDKTFYKYCESCQLSMKYEGDETCFYIDIDKYDECNIKWLKLKLIEAIQRIEKKDKVIEVSMKLHKRLSSEGYTWTSSVLKEFIKTCAKYKETIK